MDLAHSTLPLCREEGILETSSAKPKYALAKSQPLLARVLGPRRGLWSSPLLLPLRQQVLWVV